MSHKVKFIVFLILIALLSACGGGGSVSVGEGTNGGNGGGNNGGNAPPVLTFRVVQTFPHQTDAFTQGLVYNPTDGRLYESTGLLGQSSLRRVDLVTGQVLQQKNLSANIFAEGLALRGNNLIQITLNAGVGFIEDLTTFVTQATFNYTGQGWGIVSRNDAFIMSNGTQTLQFLDPTTFALIGTLDVFDPSGAQVGALNELELVNGVLFANLFLTDRIAAIDLNTGQVLFYIDLTGIIDKTANALGPNDVLNGIAYDEAGDRLFVTGKRWPSLFHIQVQ